jgi:arsenate reductase
MKIYTYKNCDTCRKALKWLDAQGIDYEQKAIRESPPTVKELKSMLAAYQGEIRKLFNTSGRDYQAMKLKDKLPKMTSPEALDLLAGNGNLIKRPFLLSEPVNLVGFNEKEWSEKL